MYGPPQTCGLGLHSKAGPSSMLDPTPKTGQVTQALCNHIGKTLKEREPRTSLGPSSQGLNMLMVKAFILPVPHCPTTAAQSMTPVRILRPVFGCNPSTQTSPSPGSVGCWCRAWHYHNSPAHHQGQATTLVPHIPLLQLWLCKAGECFLLPPSSPTTADI